MANPVDRNQLANTMMMLFRGGAPGGDPYANESSGPFANSPRIYGRSQGAPKPAAAAPKAKGAGKRKAATGPNNVPIPGPPPVRPQPVGMPMAGNATSPSSLMESPNLNATSPSSLIQTPPVTPSPQPYGGPMAAADRAPLNPITQAAMAMNPNPGQNPLGLGNYNPLTNAVDQAPRGRFRPTPIAGMVPGGAMTPGTAQPGNTGMGPSYADFWRLMQGGSGHGQMGT